MAADASEGEYYLTQISKAMAVESRRGAVSRATRFPSPLIKPDLRISRIRLSDWLHGRLTRVLQHGVRGAFA